MSMRSASLTVASAALLIYLTHRVVPNVLIQPWLEVWPGWLFSAVSITGGLALGLCLHALARRLAAWRPALRLRARPQT